MTKTFDELVSIIKKLRDPKDGCPWDLKQTHESLKGYLLEESYEVLEAIDNPDDPELLREELGDVLLQVVLHSQIADDNDQFSIEEVVSGLNQKLIERHPHVFGDAKVKDDKEVTENWEKIKAEKKKDSENQSLLSSLPKSLPALLRADKIGSRVAKVGFDWESSQGAIEKTKEELEEFLTALESSENDRIADELGDLLFCLAQIARKLSLNPEELLQSANTKFEHRFRHMEVNAGDDLGKLSAEKLQELWKIAKTKFA